MKEKSGQSARKQWTEWEGKVDIVRGKWTGGGREEWTE